MMKNMVRVRHLIALLRRAMYRIYIATSGLRPGTVGAYLVAFLSAAVATVLQVTIEPAVESIPFITFFVAVTITSLISGFTAGIFCTVLSASAAAFFALPPILSFYIERSADVLGLGVFVLVALSMVTYIAAMRFALTAARHPNSFRGQAAPPRSPPPE